MVAEVTWCDLYNLYDLCDLYGAHRAHVLHRAKGFLRRIVVYLKDHSPYPDSSLFIVNLRIQLELIY